MQPNLLIVCGPTAAGKTRLGVELALALDGEVVSADSMQVYRGMDIGTAKPTTEEMRGVPHHMLSVADPREDYSVGRYVADAVPIVDDILARGRLPILVGGTGLYIDALEAGRSFAPAETAGVRTQLQRTAEMEGLEPLLADLRRVDPERADRLDPHDAKRIIRALEVFYATGETITQHDRRTQALPPRYRAARIVLSFQDRADLRTRIDRRVDEMFAAGLEAEVRRLLAAGVPATATAMQAIGYKELATALSAGLSMSQAAAEIRLRTRQYAKRQLTWFRRNPDAFWILQGPSPDFSEILHCSTTFFHSREVG